MPPHAFWRRLRHPFSISAPRMAVRNELAWPVRIGLVVALLVIIGGMWWWGFDFGQIFGRVHRSQMQERVDTLEADNARLAGENRELHRRAMELESDAAIGRGTQSTLTRQVQDLSAENAQIKEELAFLQKLVSDSTKEAGLSIQRLTVVREADNAWHYAVLVVRGGNPKDDFAGHLVLTVATTVAGDGTPRSETLTIPPPDGASPLKLRFKYYQRVEGMLDVPPGARVTSVTARAFEDGAAVARATRTLTNP
ncbi:MAG: hypothetical protein JSR18_04015 [Proteobacteria bacterium]|nr:hypothetical protein [Pseudomonadota bacterium]